MPSKSKLLPSSAAQPSVSGRALRSAAVIFFALALGGAGCGSSKPAPAANRPAGPSNNAPAQQQQPTANAPATPPAAAKAAPADSLAAFGKAYGNVEGEVHYLITTTGKQASQHDLTYFWKPSESKTRVDVASDGKLNSIIYSGDTTIACPADQNVCYSFSTSAGGAAAAAMARPPVNVGDLESHMPGVSSGGTVTETHSTVLNRAATCFTATPNDAKMGGPSTICYDDATKIMLSLKGTSASGDVTTVETKDISASVPDSTFTPPKPVKDLSSMMPSGATMPSGQ